ncbi:MAG: 30S ribosomal protein S17e [Hadesarchaea archaeon YNP_N21]|jgi:small subunit ribosomal protein S17e|nr:MAG: 30S ribosomal protein S17e [Hadesarchaea archaeon YNP_N21]
MGRIRQGHVKRAARMLLETYPDKFSTDYEQNQHVLDELAIIESKPLKNRIAGYIVTLLKQKTKEV